MLGGTSLLSKFWTRPPSLPLSGNTTHCKVEQALLFVCAHVFWFVFCCCFFGWTKKQNTQHKRKLREEIKSSFFSRNCQLISNSTICKAHSTWHYEYTCRKRAYGHSVIYIYLFIHLFIDLFIYLSQKLKHIFTHIYIYVRVCKVTLHVTCDVKTSLKIRKRLCAKKSKQSIHIKENGLHN